MADLTVDPSQVHTIEVDPSAVQAANVLDDPKNVRVGTSNGIPVYRNPGGFWDAFLEGSGGKALLDMMAGANRTPEGAKKTLDTVKSFIQGIAAEPGRVWNELSETGRSMLKGDIPAAAYHAAGSVPLVGAPAQQVGRDFENGDYARGFGHALGLLVPFMGSLVPEKISAGPLVESKLNPVEQSAVDLLKERGVPLRVGTQTGNKFVRSAEAVTQHSPLGAEAAEDLAKGTEEGLRRTAGDFAYEQFPVPVTPESAGRAVTSTLSKNIERLGLQSDAAYKDAWAGRSNPNFSEEVPVRTEQRPVLGPDGTPTGDIAERTVTKRVNMPVDVRQIKEALKPVYAEMQWMPAADRNSSAGFQAVKNILDGDDFIPAWQAERGLSGLKAMARTDSQSGVRNTSQGIGASIVPQLQELVDSAVAKTGDQAIRGLQRGRALHATKMEVAEIADQLRDEPVQNFGKLVWAHDSGVDFLRKIADQAPETMPEVGRAFVDQLFDQATREGGFARARSILNQWQNLGPETKKILFPNPAVRSGLDRFFKGAEMVGQTPNPSGTALVNQATSLNPLRWLAGYAGSKLLFTPRGAAILTEGLNIPLGGPRAAAAQVALNRLIAETAAATGATAEERK
jgi:hypothetical protein